MLIFLKVDVPLREFPQDFGIQREETGACGTARSHSPHIYPYASAFPSAGFSLKECRWEREHPSLAVYASSPSW